MSNKLARMRKWCSGAGRQAGANRTDTDEMTVKSEDSRNNKRMTNEQRV